jgi:glycosyltransferase involved in cell wall biosynthesis
VRLLAAWSRKPERIVFNSYAGMAYHRKQGYKPWQRMEVIPSGVNTDAFRPSAEDYRWLRDMLKLPPHMLLIGMVARVDPMKDYRTFLVAASICAHADVRFVIVGKGTDELSTYGNQGVYRLGERQDIARILAGLDLFTLTSFSEGCPNVLLEAMASGLPCIASDVGDNAQLLGKEYVIPVHSVSALSQQWLALLQAPTLRQEIGLRNRRHAIERYNMPRVAQKYDQCYSRPSA